MNRYSPHYDSDERRTTMSIDTQGSWVHIKVVEELLNTLSRAGISHGGTIEGLEQGLSVLTGLRAEVERLRELFAAEQKATHAALVRDAAEIARLRAALIGLLHQVRPSQEAVDFATAALAGAPSETRRALAERVREACARQMEGPEPTMMDRANADYVRALNLDALLEKP